MNRDELLTNLAMELAEWPNNANQAAHILPKVCGMTFPDRMVTAPKYGLERRVGGLISEGEYLQRRAELINRPSWSDAPKWAQWLAQDANGEWWRYEKEPYAYGGAWVEPSLSGDIALCSAGKIPAGHNWRETLEQRHAECQPTVEEDEACNAMAATAEQPHVTDARRLDAMLAEDMGKDSVSATLDERGKRYGDFSEGAAIMQSLKDEAHEAPGWQRLSYAQREAVDMILHKIGRALNGDPDYADNWHDIAGYAQLVERTLTK